MDAARRWIDVVLRRGDMREAWPLTDAAWRRQLAEAWFRANESHLLVAMTDGEALIADLSSAEPTHPLTDSFLETQTEEFQEVYSNVDIDKRGWASKPRPQSPGYEIVLLVEAEGGTIQLEENTVMPALRFLMHLVEGEGWKVAQTGGSEL